MGKSHSLGGHQGSVKIGRKVYLIKCGYVAHCAVRNQGDALLRMSIPGGIAYCGNHLGSALLIDTTFLSGRFPTFPWETGLAVQPPIRKGGL
jgi:hypothetical protein